MVVLVSGHSVSGSGSSFTINHSCDKRGGGPVCYTALDQDNISRILGRR